MVLQKPGAAVQLLHRVQQQGFRGQGGKLAPHQLANPTLQLVVGLDAASFQKWYNSVSPALFLVACSLLFYCPGQLGTLPETKGNFAGSSFLCSNDQTNKKIFKTATFLESECVTHSFDLQFHLFGRIFPTGEQFLLRCTTFKDQLHPTLQQVVGLDFLTR